MSRIFQPCQHLLLLLLLLTTIQSTISLPSPSTTFESTSISNDTETESNSEHCHSSQTECYANHAPENFLCCNAGYICNFTLDITGLPQPSCQNPTDDTETSTEDSAGTEEKSAESQCKAGYVQCMDYALPAQEAAWCCPEGYSCKTTIAGKRPDCIPIDGWNGGNSTNGVNSTGLTTSLTTTMPTGDIDQSSAEAINDRANTAWRMIGVALGAVGGGIIGIFALTIGARSYRRRKRKVPSKEGNCGEMDASTEYKASEAGGFEVFEAGGSGLAELNGYPKEERIARVWHELEAESGEFTPPEDASDASSSGSREGTVPAD